MPPCGRHVICASRWSARHLSAWRRTSLAASQRKEESIGRGGNFFCKFGYCLTFGAKTIKMKLEELNVYNLSMEMGERAWTIVKTWDYFSRETIGKQLVRAADSVAANLSEGFGRYHYKENTHFGYYSRGSLFETKTWFTKAKNRGLLEESEYNSIITTLDEIGVKLNNYIKSIGRGSPTS